MVVGVLHQSGRVAVVLTGVLKSGNRYASGMHHCSIALINQAGRPATAAAVVAAPILKL